MVSRREWLWVNLFALAFILLTLIPYGVGWRQADSEWSFNGFVFGVDDGNAYLGKMRLGWEGEWSFHLFYTPEDHKSEFGFYLPYILLGHLTHIFMSGQAADDLALMFQLWRIVSAWLLILVMYRFIAVFIHDPARRWWALLLSTLAGGLGWILILLGQSEFLGTLPLEFYVPEAFSFLPLYGLPHIAMGRAMLLLGFILFLQLKWGKTVWAGICWNIVGLMVTFYLPLIYAILGAWGLVAWWREKQFPFQLARHAIFAAALTLPQLLYSFWIFTQNEAFAEWSAQNYLPSPNPLHYVVAYGILVGFVIWGLRSLKLSQENSLLLGWVLIVPILVYLPINVQRRLSEAVLIPLVLLGIERLWNYRKIVLGLLLPSTILLWIGGIVVTLNPGCSLDVCLFRSSEERAALLWLEEYAESDAIVLGSFRTGNYLPILTDLRPFLGLGTETLNSEEKADWVEQFYRGELSEKNRVRLWEEFNVQYVVFGALEQELYPDSNVWSDGMKVIYASGTYQIFEVEQHVSARNQIVGFLGDFRRGFDPVVFAASVGRKSSILGATQSTVLPLA